MASSRPDIGPPSGAPCAECGAPLAADQAYCVQCGARRGPLPARVAVALADIEAHGRAIAPDDPLLDDDPQPEDEPQNIVSAARAGVIGLLMMLAFGVVIGGAFSTGGLGALANTIVVAVRPSVQQAAQVVTTVSGGGSGGGSHTGSGGGGSGGGGGGGGGGQAAPATTPATTPAQAPVTVTVSETSSTSPDTGTTPQATLPSIDHVWLIVLGQQGYQQAWATSAGHPYLGSLRKQGELVTNYDAVASSPLANEVALISGQGPTQQTAANCPTYAYIDPGKTGKHQQVLGDGCIYPQTTESLPQQFVADGLSWKAYVQGIGEGCATQSGSATSSSSSSSSTTTSAAATSTAATSTAATSTVGASTTSSTTTAGACPAGGTASGTTTVPTTTSTTPTTPTPGATTPSAPTTSTPGATTPSTPTPGSTTPATPTPGSTSSTTPTSSTDPVDTIGAATCPHPALNSPSLNQSVTDGSTYVNWKNPVIYFQGLLLPSGLCQTNDVGIGQLATDLKNPGATPTFSYVSPDPCDDGSDTPCRPGAKAGLKQADVFLRRVVPEIERSASYKEGGLILITFASAPQSGPHWDTSSCCGQPTYPNVPSISTTSPSSTSTSPGSSSTTSTSSSSTTTPPVVTDTETVTTTTTSPTGSTTDTGTTPGASSACTASGSNTSSSSSTSPSTSTTPTPTTTPGATTASASTTTSATTTPGECAPVIVGTPPGGGQVGLLMISPWIDPDKTDVVDTLNHFSVLKGIEQLFKLPNLGYAKVGSLQGFGLGMFASSKH
jgi:hypothetical protein